MKRNSWLGVMVLVMSACAVPPGGMKGTNPFGEMFVKKPYSPVSAQQQYYVDESIYVVTEPPGARILLNETPVGYSPIQVPVRRMWRGDPRYQMTLDTVKIEAFPISAGQCVQSGIYGQNSAKAPSQVVFKMTDCQASK